jgi:PadR family transcriptional regulator AphA
MRQSKTIFALLGWLTTESLSGYDLKQRTERYVGEFWYGSFGQIYPLLHQMLKEGLVTVHEEQQGSHPPRKVYTITESGRAMFNEWMAHETEPDFFRSELLLKLFFGNLTSPSVLCTHVEKVLDEARRRLSRYSEIRKAAENKIANFPNLTHMLITLDRGFIVQQGYVEWAERTLDRLRALKNTNEGKEKPS